MCYLFLGHRIFYYIHVVVEFVAYDFNDNMDVLDVIPYTEY